ncbi:MAG TPA: hypothetical protein VM487_02255 [Phycisphaerae bacterium]|nr:hypothetical protein [Phycisphaerae bacterium]
MHQRLDGGGRPIRAAVEIGAEFELRKSIGVTAAEDGVAGEVTVSLKAGQIVALVAVGSRDLTIVAGSVELDLAAGRLLIDPDGYHPRLLPEAIETLTVRNAGDQPAALEVEMLFNERL